jgi:hypothetical protein
MKVRKVRKRSLVVVVVAVAAMLALVGPASAQTPVTGDALLATQYGWSALDNVDRFTDTLQTEGFSVEQGEVGFFDWVQATCLGTIVDTAANNPWPNIYVTVKFGTGPLSHIWQLGENEAIVMVGQTPPPAAYFSYTTILGFLPDDPETEVNESQQRLGVPVGDTVNIGTVRTIGSDKFRQPMVYIITGHRGTEPLVRAAAVAAGYPEGIINVETISPAIGPLGHGSPGSVWFFAQRVAVPDNKDELEDWVKHAGDFNKVFRITPNRRLAKQLGEDPQPVPILRVRGTGHTEMELYLTLQRLRKEILNRYAPKASVQPFKELDSKIWELDGGQTQDGRELRAEKPYVGLQRGITVIGATRDTNYLASYPNFKLREGKDEFVIVYGVNHQQTGKTPDDNELLYDRAIYFGPYFTEQ